MFIGELKKDIVVLLTNVMIVRAIVTQKPHLVESTIIDAMVKIISAPLIAEMNQPDLAKFLECLVFQLTSKSMTYMTSSPPMDMLSI